MMMKVGAESMLRIPLRHRKGEVFGLTTDQIIENRKFKILRIQCDLCEFSIQSRTTWSAKEAQDSRITSCKQFESKVNFS